MGRTGSGLSLLVFTLGLAGGLATPAFGQREIPGRFAGDNIVIGLEYALADSERATAAMARVFAETGLTGMKNLGEAVAWGAMQKSPTAPIVFDKVDWFVREYQRNGFTDLTLPLKAHCRWGSKDSRLLVTKNSSPKPRYVPHFRRWVTAVVERYDADGVDDMPGLRWPVNVIEIGTEFSSYQPEPVGDYLEMLEVAYEAAHRASSTVRVAHSAFLTTPVDLDVDHPRDYPRAWRETEKNDTFHGLDDMRAVLDRPDLFDVINLHNLGAPTELEHQLRWIEWETARRGYTKSIIVSDTVPTPYIAWGPATTCEGRALGVLVPPATEADRCRLAAFFERLVARDRATLAWTRGFVAADHVQRTIIAADLGIERINLSFVADLPLLTGKLARAGAGIAAWGGAVRLDPWRGVVHERYPLFHAIRQLMSHLGGYRSIERVRSSRPEVRVYKIGHPAGNFRIAWRDPGAVLLPGDGEPEELIEIATGAGAVRVEPVITAMGEEAARVRCEPSPGGVLRLRLTHTPVYLHPVAPEACAN